VICLVTQADICQTTLLLFTNHFEGICDDYFIIIFEAKRGIWKVCGGVSEFTKWVMGRMLLLCSFATVKMSGSVV
jgi:hypothetical protein